MRSHAKLSVQFNCRTCMDTFAIDLSLVILRDICFMRASMIVLDLASKLLRSWLCATLR